MIKVDSNKSLSNALDIGALTVKFAGLMVLGFFVLSALWASPAHAIKKCKDADGNWHYGDFAVKACEQSKVTTLSDRGTVRHEKPAPKSEEELLEIERKQQLIIAEQEQKELEEKEKTRILSIYETEADIDRQRDNQLYSIDSNIAVHDTFLESVDEQITHEQKKLEKTKNEKRKQKIQQKIDEVQNQKDIYSQAVLSLREERKAIVEKFEKEKQLYIKLTKGDSN